jgi:hypothetical protein
MSKPSFVIVIVEDEHHEMLVRRYLKKRGMGPHQVTFVQSPSGEGSAEQWVRTRFAKEVRAYRNRQARAETALILVIDADTHTVRGRLTQLDRALREGGVQAVRNDEQIARVVPKRNVETWILCLNEQAVDEETDYKGRRDDWNELIPQAAETLFQWARSQAELPNHCIESLRAGIGELNRVRF